jgi:REP element-mobilizing transposase RayT
MSRDYLNPDAPIEKRPGQLPHWEQDEVMQFVTFRLGDSLPKEKIFTWKSQSREFRNTWPQPWSADVLADYNKRFTVKLERWLDEGNGSCLLREPAVRKIIDEVIMCFQGDRVEHHAWVIMPNHLHLLFKPVVPMESLIKSWKGVSARKIGKGSIWQPNYRDTLIRDGEHFANAVRYIRRNPVKAKLKDRNFTLWESERAKLVK